MSLFNITFSNLQIIKFSFILFIFKYNIRNYNYKIYYNSFKKVYYLRKYII